MSEQLKMVLLPTISTGDITVDFVSQDSKGNPATPAKLLKLLKCQMEVGVGLFLYRKKDGTLRKAIGTLSPNIIPLSKLTGKDAQETGPKQNYYDLEVNDFRAFVVDNLVAVLMF